MIELWYDDGVHVRGHLMFGLYGLGANKKRILAWLDYQFVNCDKLQLDLTPHKGKLKV